MTRALEYSIHEAIVCDVWMLVEIIPVRNSRVETCLSLCAVWIVITGGITKRLGWPAESGFVAHVALSFQSFPLCGQLLIFIFVRKFIPLRKSKHGEYSVHRSIPKYTKITSTSHRVFVISENQKR
jgi:hypothetical protein